MAKFVLACGMWDENGTMPMVEAIFSGFLLSMSLIAVIGAQNAFVLNQGLRNGHIFAVCCFCFFSDIILIWLGVFGFSYAVDIMPKIVLFVTYAGAIFLLIYGMMHLKSAFMVKDRLEWQEFPLEKLSVTLVKCAMITWLNPHVYLDTVILLGSVSTSYGENRYFFGAGAALASPLFFFSLGFLSQKLSPVLSTPKIWRRIDFFIGLTMLALAIKLYVMA